MALHCCLNGLKRIKGENGRGRSKPKEDRDFCEGEQFWE